MEYIFSSLRIPYDQKIWLFRGIDLDGYQNLDKDQGAPSFSDVWISIPIRQKKNRILKKVQLMNPKINSPSFEKRRNLDLKIFQ